MANCVGVTLSQSILSAASESILGVVSGLCRLAVKNTAKLNHLGDFRQNSDNQRRLQKPDTDDPADEFGFCL